MEFRAALISTVFFLPMVLLHIILCQALESAKAIRWMFVSFAVYIAFVVALFLSGYFAVSENDELATSFVTLLATAGFWCLCYMEGFSMLCRGFSLSILVHLNEKPGDTVESIVHNYGGVGAVGLLKKRLASLQKLNFIRVEDKRLYLNSSTAKWIAILTWQYKKILNLGRGG